MTTRNVQLFTALALTTGFVRTVCAANQDSPWGVAIYGGDSVAVTGSLRSPATTSITDLGSIDPAFAGSSGTLSLDKLRYDDLFRRRFDTGLELNYTFDDHLQSYGRFSYDSLGGRTRNIGMLSSGSLATPVPLKARFSDADNSTLELGSRYLWTTGSAWQPYAGVALGATRMDAMQASLLAPDTSIDLRNVRFTRTGTVFSQSLETGVEYNPSPAFGVRFSVDADHTGTPPSARNADLTELGFNAGHDAESRWAFPVAIAASYHFD